MNKKPNLVYVYADQLRYFSCGYSGDELAKTPCIDSIAASGRNFYNAVSGHPVCAPYRASLFTGKYTTSTGMVINEIRLNPKHHQRSFAHVLKENGYHTAYIGKWHMYANELGNHYDVKNSFIPKGPDRLGFDEYFAAYNFHHEYNDVYYHLDTPEKIVIKGYEPDGQADLCIKKIEEYNASGEPFAVFLSMGTPHDPWDEWNCPPEYYGLWNDSDFTYPPNYCPENDPHADDWAKLSEKEREALLNWKHGYYSMTAHLDKNVGRVHDKLEELGIAENTIFIFTSDHGEMFGAHGRRAKNIFYEEAVRIPFLIEWKGKIEAASRSGVPFNTVDIMPTLLSMMDLPVPDSVQGTDLSEAVFGRMDDEPFGCLMQGTGATAAWEDGHEWRAVRSRRYTYAIYHSDKTEYLFDNITDPYQTHNLTDEPEYAEILKKHKDYMRDKMSEINDNFDASSFYRKNWVDSDRKIVKTATEEYCEQD